MNRIFVGITGASGSIFAINLIQELQKIPNTQIMVSATNPAIQVCQYETGIHLPKWTKQSSIPFYQNHNFFAPTASGSFRLHSVIIVPCSMGTLARINHGISSNLLERTADVALKEKFKLVIAPRETPLNSIHLQNMLQLSQNGAVIIPISVAFYHKPSSIQDIVLFNTGKILDSLNIPHSLFKRWKTDTHPKMDTSHNSPNSENTPDP